MVMGGSMEVGVVIAFALYIERLFGPVQEMANQFEQLQKAMVSADRIFELLDVKSEVSDLPGAEGLPPIRGEVRFEGVDFHYTPETPVLRQIDLRLDAGEQSLSLGPPAPARPPLHRCSCATTTRSEDASPLTATTFGTWTGPLSPVR